MTFTVIPDIQTPSTPKIDNIDSFLKENIESIKEFKKYAESRYDGIGLAANQCALNDERYNLRLICVKDVNTRISTIAVDPVITKQLGRKRYKLEGCLTWIGKTILAERYPVVEVEYYDLNGDKQTIQAKDFQAQVWQHEINHINGVEEEIHERNFSIPTSLKLEKLGRNEPCTCGSGLKFKKCCGQYE
jgi:peptide deformylase